VNNDSDIHSDTHWDIQSLKSLMLSQTQTGTHPIDTCCCSCWSWCSLTLWLSLITWW